VTTISPNWPVDAAMERSVLARRLSMMVMRHARITNRTISSANQ